LKSKLTNVPASVLARLLKVSRENRVDYQSLLIRYVAERFLHRLGTSEYANDFILKGAYLLNITLDRQEYRTTKDIDFLRVGQIDPAKTEEELRSICAIQDETDGVCFDIDSIAVHDIREQNAYHGQRAKIRAHIGQTRITLQIDIGIGDSVYPSPLRRSISTLLGMDPPTILSYPIETVIAEKLEAIVSMSLATSRMKDFYDLYSISSNMEIDYHSVATAIHKTFAEPVLRDETKQKQWAAFIRKLRNEHVNLGFSTVIARISQFTSPIWIQDTEVEVRRWLPESGWE
jgi:predicted nucleotidyltransferase component of viral defense system